MIVVNWHLAIAVCGGATIGLGLFLVIRELVPATPALGPALRRLHQPPSLGRVAAPTSRQPDWLTGLARWLRPPHRQLALIGQTSEQYALSVLLSALIGLATPTLLGVALFVLGISFPLVIPVLGSLGMALVAGLLAHRAVLTKADAARDEFRQAVCTYLDLVALLLSAAHGPVQSLERAAAVCDGWVFDRIQESLRIAQMQMHAPWDELRDLADKIGIPELGDVGAIMRSSGSEGAQ
ncbi:hypothetical protein, partial [Streptomyces sp. NPDC003015]